MHTEPAGRFRDIEIRLGQHFVDAFPFQGLDVGGAVGQFDVGVAGHVTEGRFDVVRVRRFRQVLAGTQLDRFDGRADAGVAGQHDNQHVRIVLVQHLHAGQARGVPIQLQVDDGVVGTMLLEQGARFIEIGGQDDLVAAPFERAAQGAGKRGIVFHDQ